MSNILQFEARDRGLQAAMPGGEAVPGQIIIFPGVRIERTGFSLADRVGDPGRDKPRPRRRPRPTGST